MSFRTLEDVAPGQRVLARLDLNSPIEGGAVQDNRRFQRHARTVRDLLADDHRVALLAHQGRPGRDDFASLEGHAEVLAEHVGQEVAFVPDTFGERAVAAIEDLGAGEVLLLENTRMTDDELPEKSPEEHARSEFVRSLAPHFDVYVNDAYSAAHRQHASLVGFPLHLPAHAGRVMVAEYEANSAIANREFDGDVTMVLGGTKATDVIHVMEALADDVDTFCMGGVTGQLFLRAAGYDVGYDDPESGLYDDQWAANHETIEALLEDLGVGDGIELPVDVAREGSDGRRREVAVADADRGAAYLDVGHETVGTYAPIVHDSAAVFVKGAVGVFEDERFSDGTVALLRAIAETDCFSVVGGGDTSRAIGLYGLDEADFSHVSIAGGAYIRALAGDPLPAVELLQREE